MVAEILDLLRLHGLSGGTVCDLTVGTAGHSLALLEANPRLYLVGFDRDEQSLALAHDRLGRAGLAGRFDLINADYREIRSHLDNLGAHPVYGIVLDPGCSLWQLDDLRRGMSFRGEGPLDMRLSQSQAQTAADLLTVASEEELRELLEAYGEESRRARKIAHVLHRSPIQTPHDLATVVRSAPLGRSRHSQEAAVTRVFAALRSAVNDELAALTDGLREAGLALAPSGRLAALSYHSGEDRIVKTTFAGLSGSGPGPSFSEHPPNGSFEVVTKKPLVPSQREIAANPRARSAKLRCLERVQATHPSHPTTAADP